MSQIETDKTEPSVHFSGFFTSPETDQLDEALAKAQSEMTAAEKDGFNPHFESKFATLSSTFTSAKPLAKHGIAVSQWPRADKDGKAHMVTRLAFKGQWMMVDTSIPVTGNNAHAWGSAFSYLKRYALQAAAGIAAEDDDGNLAVQKPNQNQRREETPRQNTIGDSKKREFETLLNQSGWTLSLAVSKASSKFGVQRISQLVPGQYQWLVAHISSNPMHPDVGDSNERAAQFADGEAHLQ